MMVRLLVGSHFLQTMMFIFKINCIMFLMRMMSSMESVAGYEHWIMENTSERIEHSYLKVHQHSKFRVSNTRASREKLHVLSFLRNKKIVFFGDSVTRYQFLSLIQYIRFLRWEDRYDQSLCCEKKYPHWIDFYRSLSATFGCSHMCDCRPLADSLNGPNGGHCHENHYFYDDELNLRIDFLFWLNGVDIGTSVFPERLPNTTDFYSYCHDYLNMASQMINHTLVNRYKGIYDFLNRVVIPTQVDVIVMNYGVWRGPNHNGWITKEGVDVLVKKMHEAAPLFIWKTTTERRGDNNPMDEPWLLERFTSNKAKIFDAHAYVTEISTLPDVMADGIHFQSFVNRELNIAFLEDLEIWFQEGKEATEKWKLSTEEVSNKQRRGRSLKETVEW